MLDPAGHYVSYIDHVRVRDTDNEHLSVAGGEWLRPLLLPQVVALGAAQILIEPERRRGSAVIPGPRGEEGCAATDTQSAR